MTELNTPVIIKETGMESKVLDATGKELLWINRNFTDKERYLFIKDLIRRANAYDELMVRMNNVINYFDKRELGQNANDIKNELQQLLTKLTNEER